MNSAPLPGEIRTFGPPGTGKTDYLADQILKAVAKLGPEAVLVSSFTRAAAVEIAARASAKASGSGIALPEGSVATLHAFCFRAAGAPALADTKEGLKAWNDWLGGEDSLFSVKDLGGAPAMDLDDHIWDRARFFDDMEEGIDGGAVLAELNLERALMSDPASWRPTVKEFAKRWSAFKAETDRMDFTDLLEFALRNLEEFPSRPRALFFDEVQDHSALELAVIRKLSRSAERVVMAGDDDQSIYGFKGATPDAFLDPPLPPEQMRFLRQSYRLPKKVLDLSQSWIRRVARRQKKEFSPRKDPASGQVVEGAVRYCPGDWEDPRAVVDLVRQRAPATVMVLGSCRFMLRPVVAALRKEGVPFHNPYRVKAGEWNPLHHAERIKTFLVPERSVHGDSARAWTWGEVDSLVDVLGQKESGMIRGAKRRLRDLVKDPRVEKAPATARDVKALFGVGRGEAHPMAWWDGCGSALDAARWYRDRCQEKPRKAFSYALEVLARQGPRALYETPRVVVGSIHSVKGGQGDVVAVFPDYSYNAAIEAESSQAGQDAVTRCFYVGVTRAREELVVCSPAPPRKSWQRKMEYHVSL